STSWPAAASPPSTTPQTRSPPNQNTHSNSPHNQPTKDQPLHHYKGLDLRRFSVDMNLGTSLLNVWSEPELSALSSIRDPPDLAWRQTRCPSPAKYGHPSQPYAAHTQGIQGLSCRPAQVVA